MNGNCFFIFLHSEYFLFILIMSDNTTPFQTENLNSDNFEELIHRLYLPLCFAANRFIQDDATSEDIVQEAFTRLWDLHDKNKTIDNIENYMYVLMHNLAMEWIRKRKMQQKYINTRTNKDISLFNVIAEADISMQIIAEIEKLPPRSREVMTLVLKGFDNQQIAEKMGITINSVKTLKYSSIRKFKTIFSADQLLKMLFFFGIMTD